MANAIIDTPARTTSKLAKLKTAGVQVVIRYYNFMNSKKLPEKRLELAEAKAIVAQGMKIAVVFEANNDKIVAFTKAKGEKAAVRAIALAQSLGQPAGSTIYFAVDADFVKASHLAAIDDYFDGVASEMNKLKAGDRYVIGAYGSGLVLTRMRASGRAKMYWLAQSTKWSGFAAFKASGHAHLIQGASTTIAGLDCDPNDLNPANPDFGAFVI